MNNNGNIDIETETKTEIEIEIGIRVAGIVNDSIVDGPGLRFTVFTQGCLHNCAGCHNPHTHDVNGGEFMTVSEILQRVDANPLLDGVTFSGGEPFLQADALIPLAAGIKDRGLSLAVYTGYLYEQLLKNEEFVRLLDYTDILIDGKFVEGLKTLDRAFAGSNNQRIIDVKESRRSGCVVEIEF